MRCIYGDRPCHVAAGLQRGGYDDTAARNRIYTASPEQERGLLVFGNRRGILAFVAGASIGLTTLPINAVKAATVQPLPPVTQADGRLGLCDVLAGNAPGTNGASWGQLAYNAGARTNRWEFRWDRIESSASTWDFSTDDAAVKSSQTNGLNVLGILIGTPKWAAASGQKPGNGLPKGLYLGYTDPQNLWAQYVRQTVTHYRGQVKYWEVWNEPDLHFFWMSSPQDYARLLKVAYLVIQEVDPAAKVLMAGMVVPDFAFLGHVLDALRADPSNNTYHGYFDIASWHAYGGAQPLYSNVHKIKNLLSLKGYGKHPLWVTEDGFPASMHAGEERQAAFVLQSIAYGLSAGANKMFIYRESDSPPTEKFGLLTSAGVPRMGYVALQVAAQYFAHAQDIAYAPNSRFERFVFYEPNRRVTLIWNRSLTNQQSNLPANAPGTTFVDWLGSPLAPVLNNAQFRLTVPGAAYNSGVDPKGNLVGGPPVVMLEDNTPPVHPSAQMYIPQLRGTGRKLLLLNPSTSPSLVEIIAAGRSHRNVVVQLPAGQTRLLDLDLLSGNDYGGMYVVSSTSPVVGEAFSNMARIGGSPSGRAWYLPATPKSLNLTNPSAQPLVAHVTAYGQKGAVRFQERVTLQAGGNVNTDLPAALKGKQVAVAVKAGAPIVVGGSQAIADAKDAWYALRPQSKSLAIFNPSSRLDATVDVRFIGSSDVLSEHLKVRSHHSVVLSPHGSRAVAVTSDRGITVGFRGASRDTFSTQPATTAAVPLTGTTTRISVFNPSQQAAHITLSLVNSTRVQRFNKTLAPSGLYTVSARFHTSPPKGALLQSDIPVVAASSD